MQRNKVQCSAVQCMQCMQCSAVQCFPTQVRCSVIKCSAVRCSACSACSAVQCSAVQCGAAQCSALQCSTVGCRCFSLTFGQSPRSAAAPRPSRRSRPSFDGQNQCTLRYIRYRSDCGVVPQVELNSGERGEERHKKVSTGTLL